MSSVRQICNHNELQTSFNYENTYDIPWRVGDRLESGELDWVESWESDTDRETERLKSFNKLFNESRDKSENGSL